MNPKVFRSKTEMNPLSVLLATTGLKRRFVGPGSSPNLTLRWKHSLSSRCTTRLFAVLLWWQSAQTCPASEVEPCSVFLVGSCQSRVTTIWHKSTANCTAQCHTMGSPLPHHTTGFRCSTGFGLNAAWSLATNSINALVGIQLVKNEDSTSHVCHLIAFVPSLFTSSDHL